MKKFFEDLSTMVIKTVGQSATVVSKCFIWGCPVYFLYNAVVPAAFNLSKISYTQTVGLLVMINLVVFTLVETIRVLRPHWEV